MTETEIGPEEIINSVYRYCKERSYGMAVWRLPASGTVNVLVSFTPEKSVSTKAESLGEGFIVAGFQGGFRGEKLFLKADVHFSITQTFSIKTLQPLLPGINKDQIDHSASLIESSENDEKELYLAIVRSAIGTIEEGRFKKLVLARRKIFKLGGAISPGKVFSRICNKYPGTFNSVTYTPEHGLWIGATPEILVSRNKEQIFRTVALAGTQPADGKSEKEAVWSQKEIEEHAYVSRFIVERLKKIRLREFEDIGPRTTKVGHLFHLKTEFIVDLKEVSFPELLSDMLDMLHPTSAVCGMPKEEAVQFVTEKEGFDRELYSGYLGPVNLEGETHIFVNLRCSQIGKDKITFYAGAGITGDSVPEKEYAETESKMESLTDCF